MQVLEQLEYPLDFCVFLEHFPEDAVLLLLHYHGD